jgi:hypothetical protein
MVMNLLNRLDNLSCRISLLLGLADHIFVVLFNLLLCSFMAVNRALVRVRQNWGEAGTLHRGHCVIPSASHYEGQNVTASHVLGDYQVGCYVPEPSIGKFQGHFSFK